MLVISRKTDECIIIEPEQGEPIEIRLLSIDNQVRVGISAPSGCKIWRKELFTTVEANRTAAENTSFGSLRSLTSEMSSGKGSD
ncbi:MAG: carbon storage regulator [Oscillospiraceae bacterium]